MSDVTEGKQEEWIEDDKPAWDRRVHSAKSEKQRVDEFMLRNILNDLKKAAKTIESIISE